MSDVPFHSTVMGRRFYEATVPKLVEELARLNKNLEALVETVELAGDRGREDVDGEESLRSDG